MPANADSYYIDVLLQPLRLCANYTPKFGGSEENGTSLDSFRELYGEDPFYHLVGLDTDYMYAAHKAAGGITSVYRQLGIGCERLTRSIFSDMFEQEDSCVCWGYELEKENGEKSKLSLDARLETNYAKTPEKKQIISEWLYELSRSVGIPHQRSIELTGSVFEVRQGYKSADSKRQNADLRNAIYAFNQSYLPVMMIFSMQINRTVYKRYTSSQYPVLIGTDSCDPLKSTFAFFEKIIGYNLLKLLVKNKDVIRKDVEIIISKIVDPS